MSSTQIARAQVLTTNGVGVRVPAHPAVAGASSAASRGSAMQIVRAGPADATAVAELAAQAFESLAVAHWLVPDPAARREVLTAYVDILVQHALALGHIDMVEDRSAAAVWWPRGAEPIALGPVYERRLRVACGLWSDRFRALDAQTAQRKPQAHHHHLALIAVAPERQATGLGNALLSYHHAFLDRHRVPAFLAAGSVRGRDMCRRRGYRAAPQFNLPDGPPQWPMWRRPNG